MAENQVDLFLDSIANIAPVKDDRALMEFPFFSLTKQPRHQPIVYDDGDVKIEVRPSEQGIANIWDKDILIYVLSLIADHVARGKPVERTMRFAAYDLLRFTGRVKSRSGHGGKDYAQLKDSLFRLRNTAIVTNVRSGSIKEDTGFGWIDSYRIVRNESDVMLGIEVTLCEWMWRAIIKERRILAVNRAYFGLTKGLERRLYELARKHCGDQDCWRIGLPKLAKKCGTERELRKFKAELSKIIEANQIPDYTVMMAYDVLPGGRVNNDRVTVVIEPKRGRPVEM